MDFTICLHTMCRRWKTSVQPQILSSCILFTFPEQVHLQQLKGETINFPSPLNPVLHEECQVTKVHFLRSSSFNFCVKIVSAVFTNDATELLLQQALLHKSKVVYLLFILAQQIKRVTQLSVGALLMEGASLSRAVHLPDQPIKDQSLPCICIRGVFFHCYVAQKTMRHFNTNTL